MPLNQPNITINAEAKKQANEVKQTNTKEKENKLNQSIQQQILKNSVNESNQLQKQYELPNSNTKNEKKNIHLNSNKSLKPGPKISFGFSKSLRNPNSDGDKIKISEFSTPKKENKWEKKEEINEVKVEIESEDLHQKITFKFASCVFNTMQVTYETPKLYSKVHKILISEENRLSDSDKYSLNGEDNIIKCIEDGNKPTKEGLEYLNHVKKHYKGMKFPEKIDSQYTRIILKLENGN
ncbi:hypothetical protein TVAG_306470 [Trichomonas vaginalis G3]|uniref:Uncharacterized protein n=1 Tax=Trichomonas vaginalis (strain ATCC PRA-98 / G3) TaxID=412133 RepID=A2DND7_TRIV3|nr:hypothetical protein TVAGG3_1024640 [Trichomonas vaginalis G3]EAY18125.1 hypothetical protein TVAG_306470 [Trichomonas vaginalis G3]KAI5492402.1 hypothetical protein TVAGG3_1024640 [Trichomonas vaginalis G3]|eukprot:XP_001579111.1 hypothetical protein [Trichomonas vaginalis G3]